MADDNHSKSKSRLKWLITILISILGSGVGIFALLEYNDSVKEKLKSRGTQ